MKPEPIKTKTTGSKGGTEVTLFPEETPLGKPNVQAEIIHPTAGKIRLSETHWTAGPDGKTFGVSGYWKGQRVFLFVPKEDYDAAMTAAKQIREMDIASYKSGSKPIRLMYSQGSPLSGHMPIDDRAGEVLQELGLAEKVSGWGTHVRPEVQKELGDSFTYEQAKALADRLFAPAREATAKRDAARQEKIQAAQNESRRTGKKVLVGTTISGEGKHGHTVRREWVDQDGKITTDYHEA